MAVDKLDLHRLIDQLPDIKTEEAARLLVALLRQVGPIGIGEAEMADEDRAWLNAGIASMTEALEDLEADVPPDELKSWLAAFDSQARPCVYVPGQGFVPTP